MNNRPWQVTSVVFVILTLLYWSNMHLVLAFGSQPKLSLDLSGLTGKSTTTTTTQTSINSVPTISNPSAGSAPLSANPTSTSSNKFQSPVNVFPNIDTSKSASNNITAILTGTDAKSMQDAIIPKEGTKSSYGLTFSLDTFNTQKQWSSSLSVDPSWKDKYQAIVDSTYHPCCGATVATNDCGHAVAMTGLVKKMLGDGKSEDEIKTELMQWEKYYFPRHFVIMGLALKKMGKDTATMDLGPNYSTVQSEKYATNYLIY